MTWVMDIDLTEMSVPVGNMLCQIIMIFFSNTSYSTGVFTVQRPCNGNTFHLCMLYFHTAV